MNGTFCTSRGSDCRGGGGSLYLANSKNKESILMQDLGLIHSWTGQSVSPFYKWGWKKVRGDRVWAERIVREAFSNAEYWLAPEDLQYLKLVCDLNEKGEPVNHEEVIERVRAIVYRNELMGNILASFVRDLLQNITNTPEEDAKKILEEAGINLLGVERILHRYGQRELRLAVSEAGREILCLGGEGFTVKDPEKEMEFPLRGIEAWSRWMLLFKEALLFELSTAKNPSDAYLYRLISASVKKGLLNDFEEDIKEEQEFNAAMRAEITKGALTASLEDLDTLQGILYMWQFNDEIPFSHLDHKRFRTFFSHKELAPVLREVVIRSIEPDFASLKKIVSLLPRNLILYGNDGYARAYIGEQYTNNLNKLMMTIGIHTDQKPHGPAFLNISNAEIKKMRSALYLQLKKEEKEQEFSKNKTKAAAQKIITPLIEDSQTRSRRKRNIEKKMANELGWIVGLPLDDSNWIEMKEMDLKPFCYYKRLLCDDFGECDFMSNHPNAREQRVQYFNKVLISIMGKKLEALTKSAAEQKDSPEKESASKQENEQEKESTSNESAPSEKESPSKQDVSSETEPAPKKGNE